MRRWSALQRLTWLAAALLQLVLPPALGALDARLEAESRSEQADSHVESHQSPNCARVHPPECAVCQHVAAARSHVAPERLLCSPRCAASVLVSAQTSFGSGGDRTPSLARAPPLS